MVIFVIERKDRFEFEKLTLVTREEMQAPFKVGDLMGAQNKA